MTGPTFIQVIKRMCQLVTNDAHLITDLLATEPYATVKISGKVVEPYKDKPVQLLGVEFEELD